MRRLSVLLAILVIGLAGQNPGARITALDGEAVLLRKGEGESLKARLMDGLFGGDTLKIPGGASVTLLYGSGRLSVIRGATAIGFEETVADTVRGDVPDEPASEYSSLEKIFAFASDSEKGAARIMVRGEEDSFVIYSPGNTTLKIRRPSVTWSRHPDGQAYVVVFQKMGSAVLSVITVDTVLDYPETKDDLAAGSYLLKVTAVKNGDTLARSERFVKILKPEDAGRIDRQVKELANEPCDSFTQQLLKAKFLELNGLTYDAIGEYNGLLARKPNEPFIHQTLFTLYTRQGLPAYANRHLDRYRELLK